MEKIEINKYMVFVECMTFNHVNFIEDAINGFCMQQTDFPFVCAIIDDASTDGEPIVIRKYFEDHFDLQDKSVAKFKETDDYVLTYARHKTNKNCFFLVFYLKYNHYGKKDKEPYYAEWLNNSKYIAICEGDDYWIDQNKLKKQVDILESNERYGCVYSNYYIQKGQDKEPAIISGKTNFVELLFKCEIATLTTCFRRSLYLNYLNEIQPAEKKWLLGDLPMWLYYSMESEIVFLNHFTSTYRFLVESASHSQSLDRRIAFRTSVFDVRSFFLKLFKDRIPEYRKLKIRVNTNHIIEISNLYIIDKKYRLAIAYYFKSFFSLSIVSHAHIFFYYFRQLLRKLKFNRYL